MPSAQHLVRLLVACAALAFVSAACTATETVTVLPEAIASATTTAEVGALTSPTPTDDTVEPTPAATTSSSGSTTASSGESCIYLGVDDFGDMQIELMFSSSFDVQRDSNVSYIVFDTTGAEIANSATFVEDLLPGEQVRMQVDTFEDEPVGPDAANITCEFDGLEFFDFGVEPFRPVDGDICRFVEVDTFGDIQIELELTNPVEEIGEIAIDYALRGPGDVRFDDGVAFADGGPGERIITGVDSFTEFPDWVSESTFTCAIVSIQGF